jgi:hypothetical protein
MRIKARILPQLRERIAKSAGYRCEYCLTPQRITGARMQIDHIIPEAADGPTTEENLWLACGSCNAFKGELTRAKDPLTGRYVRLFNPRHQKWKRHFKWSGDGTKIIGRTRTGRATVEALRLNHSEIVAARCLWVSVGWWPPDN